MLNLVLGSRLAEAESPFFWSVLLSLSGGWGFKPPPSKMGVAMKTTMSRSGGKW